jgi:acyl carrier protein
MQKSFNIPEIENKVKEILADKLNFPPDKINLNSSLVNDLGMDSFAAIELMFAMDTEFGIKVTQEEISKLITVKDVIEKIKESIEIQK